MKIIASRVDAEVFTCHFKSKSNEAVLNEFGPKLAIVQFYENNYLTDLIYKRVSQIKQNFFQV